MRNFITAIVAAFAFGLVVGAIGWAGFGSPVGQADPGPDPESPPFSVSESGGTCLETRAHAGWAHEVAVGHSFAVTLNATVVQDRGQTVSANVSRTAPETYRIDLETAPDETETSDEGKRKSAPEDCRVATDVRLATSLPTEYQEFEVAVNGRTLRTIENRDTTGNLYQLPNPINATTSAN
ncbi:hypothetical protein [Halorussus salinisoli]|uniref:hypothetical protein n=1 Tax=Halorussus salinisoli TaxID=2558242 RepID=UPI0010C16979|nr:hypothetical protein [Halorussus salinisoli]